MKSKDEVVNVIGVDCDSCHVPTAEALYAFYIAVCDVAQRDHVTSDQGRALEEAGMAVQALIGVPEGCREWGRPE